ncbi:dynein regulatory complex subunit 3-like [Tigriopus californicus]|uniref:dynein regulatory complex subunit 3-like n=1 Tax=Tigriopus californicus TaxID=6832 RepID=UPI0027DA43DC|nr:dynein regulatory complex subunit 3-like [Tigriopus californicus]
MSSISEMYQPSSKLKLPEEKSPNVINIQIICEALNLNPDVIQSSKRSKRAFEIRTAQTLRIEFRRILKIENLQHLTSLTRLFLDNNFIEEITGLECLIHLTWLDLSFNCIRQIQGLNYLDKLEVLALFGNQITAIENIDHLRALKVLRIGKNQITDRKTNIIYLRRLPALKTLSVKDNPFCEEPHWQDFIMAMLPNLMYLECNAISKAKRDAASLQHQGEVFKVKNQEDIAMTENQKAADKVSAEQRHKASFVTALRGEWLICSILKRNEDEELLLAKLLGSCGQTEELSLLAAKFRTQIVEIGDNLYNVGLEELKTRDSEVHMFEECVSLARKMAQDRSIQELELYMADKDKIVDELYDLAGVLENKEAEEITDMQREEAERVRERFSCRTRKVWDKIMSLEVILVNQTEKVLGEFEAEMTKNLTFFIQSAKDLFTAARDADTRHYRRLSELVEASEEEQFQKEDPIFANDHQLSQLAATLHDGHQEFLLEEEAKLQIAVQKWKDDFLARFMKKERKRNRERILELNHFIDTMKQEEEEEIDILPPLQLNLEDD